MRNLTRNLCGVFTKPKYRFARKIKITIKSDQDQNEVLDEEEYVPISQVKGFAQFTNFEEKSDKINQKTIKEIQESVLFDGDDPVSEKLVERPQKGLLWGLGGELMRTQFNGFDSNSEINLQSILDFLELNQIKDLEVVDLSQYRESYLYRYGVVGSIYSSPHGWKVCKEFIRIAAAQWEVEKEQREKETEAELLKAQKETPEIYGMRRLELEQKKVAGKGSRPQIFSNKQDDWMMFAYKEVMVHLVTEEQREELVLTEKWKKQFTQEEIDMYERLENSKRKSLYEPF